MAKVKLIDLVRTDENGNRVVYSLQDNETFRIGRGKDNDIIIGTIGKYDPRKDIKDLDYSKDPISTVSRNHCIIYRNENSLKVQDHNSSNLTFVNGFPIQFERLIHLSNRDYLRLGLYNLEIKIEND